MRLTPQDALEYMGTLIIILTGIPPAAAAADVLLPNWMAFTIAVSVMALAALQKQYQRKLERDAQAQPSDEQARMLDRQREIIDRQQDTITQFLNESPRMRRVVPPVVPAPPVARYGAGEEER